MRNKGKKILSLIAAIATMSATVSFAACGKEGYKGEKLPAGYDATAAVESNGGFAVKQGDFIFFINGSQTYTADNTYGKVEKGSLMCITTAQLEKGEFDQAKVVVPSLFAAQNFNAGIYLYDGYVYYATPTTDKNMHGEVENSWIDFKRAKISENEGPMDGYFFRLASNTSNYRFVTEKGVDRNKDGKDDVFCLYEESVDGATYLKSYNTATKEDTVLVKGAKSSFFYDMKDLTNPKVYYTMAVSYDIDSDNATTAQYDQLYTVSAGAKATVDASTASYTVENGVKYTFDKQYMEDNAKDKGYDLKDYSTYPYVNLGTLVLDGVGTLSGESRFNQEDKTNATERVGYTYTVSRYENGGVYFTRTGLDSTSGADSVLHYLADDKVDASKSVSNNKFDGENAVVQFVAKDTTNASSTALFEKDSEGNQVYYYVSGTDIVKATVKAGETSTLTIARKTSSATLLKIEGKYLYYYGAGSNGRNLSRVNHEGTADNYNPILILDEENKDFRPVTLPLVDYSDSWYKPEFFGNYLLYPNAQNFGSGSTAYNYIYTTRLDKVEENNEKYEAVQDYLDEYSDKASNQTLIKYFFRSDLEVPADSKAEYDEEFFAEVVEKFGENGLVKEKAIISLIGRMTEDEIEEINEAWENSLLQPEAEPEEDNALPTWAIVLIVIGGVLVVGAGVAIPLIVVAKKKAAKKREEEATVNAYKRKKIDTTDDTSIDVYADDTEETNAVNETSAEVAEEPVEQATEEATEEVTETVEGEEEK